uniref:Solanesyl diphosphate synthase 3 n=1 Tax=Rhizophora mucronata TaxID=61149 RepID=A0A2P2PPT5_RHIMU
MEKMTKFDFGIFGYKGFRKLHLTLNLVHNDMKCKKRFMQLTLIKFGTKNLLLLSRVTD